MRRAERNDHNCSLKELRKYTFQQPKVVPNSIQRPSRRLDDVHAVDLVVDLVDVDLDVDLVDVDLDVDLVDVDLEVALVDVVSLSSGCIFIFWPLGPRQYLKFLALDYTSVNEVWLGPKAKILKFRLDILASDWGRPPAVFGASL